MRGLERVMVSFSFCGFIRGYVLCAFILEGVLVACGFVS